MSLNIVPWYAMVKPTSRHAVDTVLRSIHWGIHRLRATFGHDMADRDDADMGSSKGTSTASKDSWRGRRVARRSNPSSHDGFLTSDN